MCADSWIGSDISIPVTVRITEMSKSDKEGKTHRGKPLPLDEEEARSAGTILASQHSQFCFNVLPGCMSAEARQEGAISFAAERQLDCRA